MKRNAFPASMLVLACCACMVLPGKLVEDFAPRNSVSAFYVCHGFGCTRRTVVSLTDDEWSAVRAAFLPTANSAAEERARISSAIGVMEALVGPKAGTQDDEPGLIQSVFTVNTLGQQDCIDEAYNTTVYLDLLAQQQLIRWHRLGTTARRGYFFDGWPHNTATITEAESETSYAVDSWFHGNGVPAEVVLLETWLTGWRPAQCWIRCATGEQERSLQVTAPRCTCYPE